MFSVNSLLYSSAVGLYKLFVLSAGIIALGHAWFFLRRFGVAVEMILKFNISYHIIQVVFNCIQVFVFRWCFNWFEAKINVQLLVSFWTFVDEKRFSHYSFYDTFQFENQILSVTVYSGYMSFTEQLNFYSEATMQ